MIFSTGAVSFRFFINIEDFLKCFLRLIIQLCFAVQQLIRSYNIHVQKLEELSSLLLKIPSKIQQVSSRHKKRDAYHLLLS